MVAPDWEPVIWSEEERGTGTYWGAKLPDSFMTYATPPLGADAADPAQPALPIIDPH